MQDQKSGGYSPGYMASIRDQFGLSPDVKDARAWPEITGRLKAYDLRPGDVIVIELDRDISRADAENIKGIVKDTFPGHDVMIVVGRMRVFRGDELSADLDT